MFSHRLVCLLLLIKQVGATTEDDVINALEEGEKSLTTKEEGEQIAIKGESLDSQHANEESQQLQKSGELLQEASQILAQKWAGNIEKLSEVDMKPVLGRSASLRRRGKRATKCVKESSDCTRSEHRQYRSITGVCNNLENPQAGKAVTPTRRLLGRTGYTDGLQAIRNRSVTGSPLPNPREISNILFAEKGKPVEDASVRHFHMQFGQYVAHDVIFMPSSTSSSGQPLNCSQCSSANNMNCKPIPIPQNDKYFTPGGCMTFTRSLNGQSSLGIRTQINQNTHFLDMSAVYGSEECEAASVRSFKDGQLATFTTRSRYILPPQDKNDTHNVCQSTSPNYCFIAGDFRSSLHPGLIPMHTTYIKEHNRIAMQFKDARPRWNDEKIFQETRRIMIGRHQHHVYSEYLPTLLSSDTLRKFDLIPRRYGYYLGYNSSVSPTLTTEFSAAAFRFGHSQARKDLEMRGNDKAVGALSTINLGRNIFYTESLYRNGACGSLMNGLMFSPAMKVDMQFTNPIRNRLFEIRGRKGSGVDLSAVNIMRGRDVGLLPYNETTVGLPKTKSFNDLRGEMTAAAIAALRKVYTSVDDIDLYVGILAETPRVGTLLGPTGQYIIAETFSALKKGDRFFYENNIPRTRGFSPDELEEIRKSEPSKMYCQTGDDMAMVPRNVFLQNFESVPCNRYSLFNIRPFLTTAGN